MIITYISIYICWIAYSCLEGFREALYYDLAVKEGNGVRELHKIYTIQRSMVIIPIVALSFRIDGFYSLFYFAALVLSFSYFHDGTYYVTRNDLDHTVYPKRWMDESTTSTAKIELSYEQRFSLFVLGIICLIFFLAYASGSK